MRLDALTDTALSQLVRYCDEKIEQRRDKLEQSISKQDVNQAYLIQGGIEELRHLAAAAKSELRSREKERI